MPYLKAFPIPAQLCIFKWSGYRRDCLSYFDKYSGYLRMVKQIKVDQGGLSYNAAYSYGIEEKLKKSDLRYICETII